jgi:hypothetical protein
MKFDDTKRIKIEKLQATIRSYLNKIKFNNTQRIELEKHGKIIESMIKIKYFGEKLKSYEENYPNCLHFKKEKFNNSQIFTDLLIYKNDEKVKIYTGFIDKNLHRNGNGILLDSQDIIYNGIWVDNEFTGYGKMIDSDGNLLEGKIEISV